MKFSGYSYQRPDFEAYKKEYIVQVEILRRAKEVAIAKQSIKKLNQMRSDVSSMEYLAQIRNSIDTRDAYYEKEDAYWNKNQPHYAELDAQFYEALAKTPFREALKGSVPTTLFMIAESEVKLFKSEIIPDLQRENELGSAYEKIIASAQIDFNGQKMTIPQMKPFTESTNRQIRKEANEKVTAFFVEHEAEIDAIFDEMVHVRTEMAHKLGFKDYVEMAYVRMHRFDYNREMVEGYRKAILDKVVPLTQKIYQRQTKRLGLEKMAYYDLPFEYPTGNAIPEGSQAVLVQKAQKMYQELSPETGTFFDFMVEHDLLDLASKPGKRGGGYCEYIPTFQSPFIFANFNGTSGDIDVLTHEAGHAFQVFQARWIDAPEIVFPGFESAEIHSMSMEFITWPWMKDFFGQSAQKYHFSHLASCVEFLPYGVLVDHFQHEVYTHPEMTPDERKATWRRLEKMYKPEKDYAESPDLERGIFWFRQAHIFVNPFYYIDYTLAQVCAFQFWKRTQIDHDSKAWEDYLAICKVGGTETFLEILKTGHLESPFEPTTFEHLLPAIESYLDSVSEEALK